MSRVTANERYAIIKKFVLEATGEDTIAALDMLESINRMINSFSRKHTNFSVVRSPVQRPKNSGGKLLVECGALAEKLELVAHEKQGTPRPGVKRKYIYRGVSLELPEVAKQSGLERRRIYDSIKRRSIEQGADITSLVDAEIPRKKAKTGVKHLYMFDGEKISISEIGRIHGISKETVKSRIVEGGVSQGGDVSHLDFSPRILEGRRFLVEGQSLTIKDIAQKHELKIKAIEENFRRNRVESNTDVSHIIIKMKSRKK